MLKNKVDKRKKSASEIHPLHPVYNRTWRTSVLIITFRKYDLVPEGEIFNIHIPHGISFCGLGDLMMKMDRIYDLLDYPPGRAPDPLLERRRTLERYPAGERCGLELQRGRRTAVP